MKRLDVLVQRAHNQQLTSTGFQNAADVVRWFGAMQAQDFSAAKWALALRMRGEPSDAAIDEAYNEGQILRTHLMRPTWHFVAPDDIRWLLELTAPRVNLKAATNYRKFELDGPTFKRTHKVLVKALQGGKHVSRTELKKALNRSGIAADDTVRMAHIMLRAELDGLVCSGKCVGKQFTYALLEELVPPVKRLTREEALAKLTLRYFTSHGPATLQDFVWWSGLTTADARRGLALIGTRIQKAVVDENDYYFVRSTLNSQQSAPAAFLLPVYDEYNIAYKERHISPLGPHVMIGGRIVGPWKATIDKKALTIVVNTGRSLTKSERSAIAKAAQRYATFLGFSAECLTFVIQTC